MVRILFSLIILFLSISPLELKAQSSSFDLQAYKDFLEQNSGLTFSGIKSLYPTEPFAVNAPAIFEDALFADSVNKYYRFNEEELGLLNDHGFMVSDRIRYKSFGEALMTIYKRDLPVYISSDAILHAVHMSYSNILSSLEKEELYPRLVALLSELHNELSNLKDKYATEPEMLRNLMDVDVYLTVPLLLLNENVIPLFEENTAEVDTLLKLIDNQMAVKYPLFQDLDRDIDFSQFTPRGHYTQEAKLTRYFKAVMWLGRTEMYLIIPEALGYFELSPEQKDSTGQRQTIDAFLVNEALSNSETAQKALGEIEELIQFLVGESDNVLPEHLDYLKGVVGFEDASSLLDINVYKAFAEKLKTEPFAEQRILSQILVQSPNAPDGIKPASAFLLLGQRFIIDSYILGNVVFDKVFERRMLPKSADVLFALGNDDALALLKDDLEYYDYALNLAGVRYLVDSYEQEYWEQSFFNLWLNAIRSLNPPEDRANFPEFTQTEGWSNKMMTTQLASWAELRHDNLLYAKQSYTGGPVCKFPYSYVEPVPKFFDAIQKLSVKAHGAFSEIDLLSEGYKGYYSNYFNRVAEIADTLGNIAQNQISGIENSDAENLFLREMLHEEFLGCVTEITGWYRDLYLTGEAGLLKEDFIVADVHTSPFDERGAFVGWVMHAGTGPVNLATLVTELPDGNTYTFVGPVMSYYEYVSTGFKRLTDEEWAASFETELGFRPEFVESYLSTSGEHYYDHRDFVITSTEGEMPNIPQRIELTQNYPNPFNAGTVIGFRIPSVMANQQVLLQVFNIQGQLIETLIDRRMPSGNFTVRWNPTSASGTYFYRLKVAGEEHTNKMVFIK